MVAYSANRDGVGGLGGEPEVGWPLCRADLWRWVCRCPHSYEAICVNGFLKYFFRSVARGAAERSRVAREAVGPMNHWKRPSTAVCYVNVFILKASSFSRRLRPHYSGDQGRGQTPIRACVMTAQ